MTSGIAGGLLWDKSRQVRFSKQKDLFGASASPNLWLSLDGRIGVQEINFHAASIPTRSRAVAADRLLRYVS